MADDQSPVTEDELHAYVDGELPANRKDAVAAWLAVHDDAAKLVTAWRIQADTIRARYGTTADDSVPAHLNTDRLTQRNRSWIAAAAAAVVATFLIGGATGWFVHGAMATSTSEINAVANDAIGAHKLYVVEVRHAVEVPGEERTHIRQWLSKRVGYQLSVPDLQSLGLKLVGGRLLPGTNGAAAFYMYEGASGERFTLYSAHSKSADMALHFRSDKRIAAYYWVDKEVAYAVSGPADRDRLETITKAIYDQIDKANVRRL